MLCYNRIMKIIMPMLLFAAAAFLLAAQARAADRNAERDYEIALTKGQYAIELEDYSAAIEQLNKALALKPDDQEATVSLGIAYARSGALAKANDALAKAVARDPNDGRARYEHALVLAKLGKEAEAKAQMTTVLQGADEELKAAAEGFLSGGAAGAEKKGPFSLGLSAGALYDSNVILEPDNPVGPRTKKSDWLGVLSLDAAYAPVRTEGFDLTAGYRFYQSLHHDLSDFNVQQHALRAEAGLALSESSRASLTYEFLYSFVGGDHYSTTHLTSLSLSVALLDRSLTELHGSYASKRYFDSVVFTDLTVRNGSDSSAGLSHTLLLGKKAALSADYTFDKETADTDAWSSTGNKGTVSALLKAGNAWRFFLSASYLDRKYDGLLPGASEKRHDGAQVYVAGVTRTMGGNVSVKVTEDYTINDSNLQPYQYKRNLVGVMAEWKL